MASKRMRFLTKLILCAFLIPVLAAGLSGCDLTPEWSGEAVPVLVVMMKFNKEPNCPTLADCAAWFTEQDIADIHEPRFSAYEYVEILDLAINGYYQKASFGQMYFDFELLENPDSKDGWWDSPYTLATITQYKIGLKQVAMNIAYTELHDDLNNYERIIFISNIQKRGGQMCCVHYPTPFYAFPWGYRVDNTKALQVSYPIIPMIVAEIAEGESKEALISITSHELGHMIGAPDLYYGNNVGLGHWDIMHYDPTMFHFSAWTKLDRGWLDWSANTTRMPCDKGSCEITTVLDPVEKMGNNALLIPTRSSAAFVGIMAECRKPINGDENIYEEGVLVTLSNPYGDNVFAGTVSSVLTNETYAYSLLQPGESYYNVPAAVRITNLSKPGDATCTVLAQRSVNPAPDLFIRQGPINEDEPYDKYQSPDIWNDSMSSYGMDGFPPSQKITVEEMKAIESSLVVTKYIPSGNGDPISLGGIDSLDYIIHNGGSLPGENFNVNIYMRQPISSKIATENCGAPADEVGILPLSLPKLIDTAHGDSILPGESQFENNLLNLDSPEPLEIKVEIEAVDGELDLTNNVAYETFAHFTGGTFGAVELSYLGGMSMMASDKCLVGIPFEAMEVPDQDGKTCDSWNFNIEPASGRMQPGETVNFNVFGAPKPDEKAGTSCRSKFCVLMPLTGDLMPVQCFNFEARVVDPSSISCATPGGPGAPNEPVTITGKLEPSLSDVVSLVYTNPAGEQETKTVLSASNGAWQDVFTPGLTGNWSVEAFWSGDETHALTSSSPCPFTVEKKVEVVVEPPLFKAVKRANCREGNSVL